jgi:hypothetical protein
MKYEALKKEYYAVYEKEPRHQNEKNGVILAPYNSNININYETNTLFIYF